MADWQPGSLRCVARRAETARKKRPGHFGRDDGFVFVVGVGREFESENKYLS